MDDDKQSEMIVRIDQKVSDLCKSIDNDSKTNIKTHDEILKKIEDQRVCIMNQSNRFIQSRLFYWVMGFIVLGVFTVAGIASNNYNSIVKIETKIENIIEK